MYLPSSHLRVILLHMYAFSTLVFTTEAEVGRNLAHLSIELVMY